MTTVSFHVPKAWMQWLKQLADKYGGMNKLVAKALEELILQYKQPEFMPGRPRGAVKPLEAPQRAKRRRSVAAVKPECNRCCQLAAEAERWWQKYLAHLIERAKSERGKIFSVVVTRDMRRLFSVHACAHLASYFIERLKATGCVKEVLVKSGRSAGRQGYRLVLDKQCILSLEAKHL